MRWLRLLPAVVGCCTCLAAQQLPDVNDVYASGRNPARQRLGPTSDPGEILDRFTEWLQRSDVVGYDVHVSFADETADHGVANATGAFDLRGTVVLGRGPRGAFDRFRITVDGTTPDLGTVAATLGSTDGASYVFDALAQTMTEYDAGNASSPWARLVRFMLIAGPLGGALPAKNDGAPTFLGPTVVDGEPCSTVHFVETRHEEHVYGSFSVSDALPRRIERVSSSVVGRPRVVRTDITHLQPQASVSAGFFEPPKPPDALAP